VSCGKQEKKKKKTRWRERMGEKRGEECARHNLGYPK